MDLGRRRSATRGAPPATSRRNWNSVMGILDQPAPAGPATPARRAGTTRTCWRSATAACPTPSTRAHFSLWALMNAPLLAGNDLRTMSAATLSILTNTEVIAVDQDWGGKQGTESSTTATSRSGPSRWPTATVAVVLLNRGSGTATIIHHRRADRPRRGVAATRYATCGRTRTSTTSGTDQRLGAGTRRRDVHRVRRRHTAPAAHLARAQGQGSGRCLDITGGSQANGAFAEIWDCNGGANQTFTRRRRANCGSTTAPSAWTSYNPARPTARR